jgi:hypothetical protein
LKPELGRFVLLLIRIVDRVVLDCVCWYDRYEGFLATSTTVALVERVGSELHFSIANSYAKVGFLLKGVQSA